jgi:flavin reductase (DIM6/NTAB) family NADH-FMN oxidoreductase RutF
MKIKVGRLPYIYPVPIVLAGAMIAGKASFTTLGDVGLMGIDPPLVYISSHRKHYLNQGILETGCYSINFPTSSMLPLVDYCGQVSGRDADKGALFEVFYGILEQVPMILDCPVNLECRVVKEFSIQHRQVFVGEVAQTYVDEPLVSKDQDRFRITDLGKLDPIIYALDNVYYRVGPPIGIGYQEARKLKEEQH